jgi:hypothetical protein
MDLDSNVDYGPQLNVLVWMLTSVSGLFLLARLYLKTCQNRGLWWDDWILLASWIALIASASIIAYVISLGYGKRLIPLANLPYFGLPVNILSTLMIITNLWGKTSFGMTLIRIPVPWMRFSVWYILVTLTLTLTASVVFVWVECGPLKLPGRCVPVDVSIRYNVFSCGKGVSRAERADEEKLTLRYPRDSVLGRGRHCAGSAAVEVPAEPGDEQKGEDWRRGSNEHGRTVSDSNLGLSDRRPG